MKSRTSLLFFTLLCTSFNGFSKDEQFKNCSSSEIEILKKSTNEAVTAVKTVATRLKEAIKTEESELKDKSLQAKQRDEWSESTFGTDLTNFLKKYFDMEVENSHDRDLIREVSRVLNKVARKVNKGAKFICKQPGENPKHCDKGTLAYIPTGIHFGIVRTCPVFFDTKKISDQGRITTIIHEWFHMYGKTIGMKLHADEIYCAVAPYHPAHKLTSSPDQYSLLAYALHVGKEVRCGSTNI